MVKRDPGLTFDQYVGHLEASGWIPGHDLDAAQARAGQVKVGPTLLIPKAFRSRVKTILTAVVRPWQRRKAAALLAVSPELKLHLGCGYSHLDGWVNIDVDISTHPDLVWDLRRPVPFPDLSAAAIFHEHLLEHIPLSAAGPFLRECHRLLKPGGILRVGVPDFGRYARDYCGSRSLIQSERPGRPTALLALSELVFCYEHTSIWDEETLIRVVREAGFESPEIKAFGETSLQPVPDRPWRQPETLYVEVVKS